MRKYRRITYEDRCQIYALSRRGVSQESIAGVLGVSQSTVSREMCRNRGQRGWREFVGMLGGFVLVSSSRAGAAYDKLPLPDQRGAMCLVAAMSSDRPAYEPSVW